MSVRKRQEHISSDIFNVIFMTGVGCFIIWEDKWLGTVKQH